ncbi:hypothetical protein BW723_13730 [Polaribacter reichenbachii]|uniref:Uncharacterized protein n=1 Tax=Polaribacter reichenbachii TaxID=996801 RepID=A0A1B8U1L2_9FLAO|nr:hypothetical protein [Polaribacter reichenbachii]APZ47276.1 hypothetical protein BW723_13730 [Polaribacter reichenbachii]AUC17917.1 hypothetical protein BTO17_04185 [Polaribacter reichenbachii]OBY65758.1 hypothetical protein LPB301_08050 [Polaribacter reichenbachii]
MNTNKDTETKIYKDVETEGITENVAGEQTIQTEETKILKGTDGDKDKEVLIGKDIGKIDEIQEGHNTLQKRILAKMMK